MGPIGKKYYIWNNTHFEIIFVSKFSGLRCIQCDSKDNSTRPERDACYNNPKSLNSYCDSANYTTCSSVVSSYKERLAKNIYQKVLSDMVLTE